MNLKEMFIITLIISLIAYWSYWLFSYFSNLEKECNDKWWIYYCSQCIEEIKFIK
jgi:hypothetical protein